LHFYDQGQFYQSLSEEERQLVYSYLSPKELADMFDVIEEDDEHMDEYLNEMRPQYAADMLAEMYTDNAVDLLNELASFDSRQLRQIQSSSMIQLCHLHNGAVHESHSHAQNPLDLDTSLLFSYLAHSVNPLRYQCT
jgi:predicted RNA-binding protein with EMAP domain